jgi:hypothetical protein
MAPKKRLGLQAVVSVQTRYIHPSKLIREKYINIVQGRRLENCVVVGREERRINGKQQQAILFRNEEEFPGKELYCVARWLKVEAEGPEEHLFDDNAGQEVAEDDTGGIVYEIAARTVGRNRIDESAITELRGHVEIDDDNLPAPENIPATNNATDNNTYSGWGHDGTCFRRMIEANQLNPRLNGLTNDSNPSALALFEALFPVAHIKNVMIPRINESLDVPTDYGEFLAWIGLWFLMATTHFNRRHEFWSEQPITPFEGAPFRLNGLMSRTRFDNILSSLQFTNMDPPQYLDRFWEVRQMLDAWNDNMRTTFVCSWIACLDESMSKWVNQYTCPGYMCVPRKPWPFGNEYHSISCGVSGIMFAIELREGKDTPAQRPAKEFDDLGKTVGLLLRLTRGIWGSGRVIILDSGFCVLLGIIWLRVKGLFASALIKKRKFWPKFVPGEDIIRHFDDRHVGTVDALRGVMNGKPFHIYAMKEPDYVMQLMSTYGTLERLGDDRIRELSDRSRIAFKYPEVVYNHYRYRDAVDNHNASRMYPIALEESWKTARWPCRVFQFLLAITEVNCRFARKEIYAQTELTQQEFRRLFARELIQNVYLLLPGERRTTPRTGKQKRSLHSLDTIPPFRTFKNSEIVAARTQYIQLKCSSCNKRVRTYCPCSPGIVRCSSCFANHVIEATTGV